MIYYYKKKATNENLYINKRILKRFSNFNLHLNYIDCGFYIFNDAIFGIIEFIKTKMENNIKEENDEKLKKDRVKIGTKLINNEKNI